MNNRSMRFSCVLVFLFLIACAHPAASDQRDEIRMPFFGFVSMVQRLVDKGLNGPEISGNELISRAMADDQQAREMLSAYRLDVQVVAGEDGKRLAVVLLCDDKGSAIMEAVDCKLQPVFEEYGPGVQCRFAMDAKARCQ